MPNKFWKFQNWTGGDAELLLYGDIASEQSWWGDEVTPKQFAGDLAGLGAVTGITVRINSGGGDVFAAQAIGNLLEQHNATVTARIDGVCASAATVEPPIRWKQPQRRCGKTRRRGRKMPKPRHTRITLRR